MPQPFKYRLRVRYHECDGQKVVFNARYAEYVDVATLEYSRVLFGSADGSEGGIDWRLVQQTMQWKAPARFDDVLEVQVQTKSLGTTSFTLRSDLRRVGDTDLLASAETVYVIIDEDSQTKKAMSDHVRGQFLAGAPGQLVDCSGVSS